VKNDQEVEQIIREYLAGVIHMSLGTSANNKPWVCEVHFVYDEHLNLYFRSKTSRRHSQEIAINPNVAGNIVEQHQLEHKPRGVYFEGTAKIVENFDEDHLAYKAFSKKMKLGTEIIDEAKNEDGHKVYKITVSDFYLFDARESKSGQKYHLPWTSAGNT
jgi:uncharacterized protein YhbP (UPF0306 family)